jgi:O-antigen ligase
LLIVAVAVFVALAAQGGGFDGTVWYPAALLIAGLLLVALVAVPGRAPRLVQAAAAAFVAYAAWSYLSIAWAAQKGDAWDGANRTLLYALVFALFALWRLRGPVAAALVGAFALGVAGVAIVELLSASGSATAEDWFIGGRFSSPATYQNANVALWTMALWPGLVLASRRELAPVVRGALAAAAVILLAAALLGQSRGWLFAAPLTGVVFLAVTPQRVRLVLTSLAVAVAVVAISGPLLGVYDAAGGPGFGDAVAEATRAIVLAALAAGGVVWVAASVERTRPRASAKSARRAAQALVATGLIAALVGGAVLVGKVGSPFTALADGWETFKTEPSPTGEGSRFSQSLGSLRYDFWRVAWNEFERRPVAGVGADNFQQAYLAQRRGYQEPRYPHSVELRVLSQTGIVGALLLCAGFVAACVAGAQAVRRRRGLGAAAAAAGLIVFASWLIHGSLDWFWEYPALGAPAFAALGLAAGLLPRPPGPRRPPVWGRALAPVAVCVLLVAATFALPWVAERYTDDAVGSWQADPELAFDRLDRAADVNPLSPLPYLYAGSIALGLERYGAAESYFRRALERNEGNQYAELELGLIAAQTGRRETALTHLARAAALNPRDEITSGALERVRRGRPVSIEDVNRAIAQESEDAIR